MFIKNLEAALQSAASKDDIREFMSVWPDLVRDLTDYAKIFEHHDAPKWFSKLLQYNVTTGKKNRGLVVVMAYKILKQNGELNDEELKLIQCLGWCVEMVSTLGSKLSFISMLSHCMFFNS